MDLIYKSPKSMYHTQYIIRICKQILNGVDFLVYGDIKMALYIHPSQLMTLIYKAPKSMQHTYICMWPGNH